MKIIQEAKYIHKLCCC